VPHISKHALATVQCNLSAGKEMIAPKSALKSVKRYFILSYFR